MILADADREIWDRVSAFVGTIQADELIDPTIAPETLLYRLFHEDGVRVFDQQKLRNQCGCNAKKIESVLSRYSSDELKEMVEDGFIRVSCEFCRRDYKFTPEGVLSE